MVRPAGFEPATLRSQSECATKLRYGRIGGPRGNRTLRGNRARIACAPARSPRGPYRRDHARSCRPGFQGFTCATDARSGFPFRAQILPGHPLRLIPVARSALCESLFPGSTGAVRVHGGLMAPDAIPACCWPRSGWCFASALSRLIRVPVDSSHGGLSSFALPDPSPCASPARCCSHQESRSTP